LWSKAAFLPKRLLNGQIRAKKSDTRQTAAMEAGVGRGDRFNEEERQDIAERIRDYISTNGVSRKQMERHDLSLHTINKALIGDFSKSTLLKIEAILQTQFHTTVNRHDEAPDDMGGYTLRSVESLQGDYLCVRQMFSQQHILTRYLISIVWSTEHRCLVFHEKNRFDVKFTQNGKVYIPFGRSFLNLATIVEGSVRNIMLHFPDEVGIMRGVMLTVFNPKGAINMPASCPIILQKIDNLCNIEWGLIKNDHKQYGEYLKLLDSVTTDEYCFISDGQFRTAQQTTGLTQEPNVAYLATSSR
jgi:hypothetical protein